MTHRYYTTKEVAELLRLSPITLSRWMREGKVKGIHFGRRRWRIPESEVERLILEGVEEPADKLAQV